MKFLRKTFAFPEAEERRSNFRLSLARDQRLKTVEVFKEALIRKYRRNPFDSAGNLTMLSFACLKGVDIWWIEWGAPYC